ncbi:MAG: hypothetical protein JW841_01440 [Deltaproteobacteria bacterium]|nr:hypothetical protein [Deltaproteobacteria bacterium]
MLKNALLTAIGLILIGLTRLGFNTIALRFFGEQITGELNVTLSLGVLLSIPASTAFGPTALRFIAQARGQNRQDTISWLYRKMLTGTVLLAAISVVLAIIYQQPLAIKQKINVDLIKQAAIIGAVYAGYLFFRNILYALDRVSFYAKSEIKVGIIFFIVLLMLTYFGLSQFLLFAFITGHVTFILITLYSTRKELVIPCPKNNHVAWQSLASFSILALLGTAASLSVREFAVFITPNAADMGAAAHLALSLSLLAPLQFLPRMLRTVLFAHTAVLDGGGYRDQISSSISLANHWLLLVTVPICSILVLLSEPLIAICGGTPTAERLLVFRLLIAAACIDVIATPSVNALPGIGNVKTTAYAALFALGITVLLWISLIPSYGMLAIAFGMLTNSVFKGGIPIIIARQKLHLHFSQKPIIMFILFILAALCLGLLHFWHRPILVSLIYLLTTVPFLWREGKTMVLDIIGRKT